MERQLREISESLDRVVPLLERIAVALERQARCAERQSRVSNELVFACERNPHPADTGC